MPAKRSTAVLKSAYVTAKHGLIGLAQTVAKEGGKYGIRANVICLGFVRTPLVEKQIPEQARALRIGEQQVVKNVMLRETVDGEFTTVRIGMVPAPVMTREAEARCLPRRRRAHADSAPRPCAPPYHRPHHRERIAAPE